MWLQTLYGNTLVYILAVICIESHCLAILVHYRKVIDAHISIAAAAQTPRKNELEYSQPLPMCTDTLGKLVVMVSQFGTATFCWLV